MKLFDMEHDWFRPLWVRVLLVVAPAVWALFEFRMGQGFWATIFAAVAAYALWSFFLDPQARRRREEADRRDAGRPD